MTLAREVEEKEKAEKKAEKEAVKEAKEAEKAAAAEAAAATAAAPLTSQAVKKMNPTALKKELKTRGLSVQGAKKDLLARLLEACTL